MSNVVDFLNRAVTKLHITRERFIDDKVPTSFNSIKILPFFGDVKAEFVLSTLLAYRVFSNDYLILLSWPGHNGLYDYVDEYWTISDLNTLTDLHRYAHNFNNTKAEMYDKMLMKYFDNVVDIKDIFSTYYHNGFTSKFLEQFTDIQYMLPSIPSANMAWGNNKSQQKKKVLICPSKYVYRYQNNVEVKIMMDELFWIKLTKHLLEKDIHPIIMQNYGTYDLSTEFGSDAFYLTDGNIMAILAVMRASNCVLDVFNGISRYALIARAPYFVCDERQRYFGTRDYILDDLCGVDIPKEFMYSFATVSNNSSYNLLSEAIVNRVCDFLDTVDYNDLPSTTQFQKQLSYDNVRKKEVRRIGARFISVPRLDE